MTKWSELLLIICAELLSVSFPLISYCLLSVPRSLTRRAEGWGGGAPPCCLCPSLNATSYKGGLAEARGPPCCFWLYSPDQRWVSASNWVPGWHAQPFNVSVASCLSQAINRRESWRCLLLLTVSFCKNWFWNIGSKQSIMLLLNAQKTTGPKALAVRSGAWLRLAPRTVRTACSGSQDCVCTCVDCVHTRVSAALSRRISKSFQFLCRQMWETPPWKYRYY